jgi:hypothetical protein
MAKSANLDFSVNWILLHAAFMMRQRELNEAHLRRPVIWDTQFDSSPQGFKDWLMCYGRLTPVCKLGKVFLNSVMLVAMSRIPDDFKSEQNKSDDVDSACYLVKVGIPLYLPPVALGSKRSSMPHKFHAMTHAVRTPSKIVIQTCPVNSRGWMEQVL